MTGLLWFVFGFIVGAIAMFLLCAYKTDGGP